MSYVGLTKIYKQKENISVPTPFFEITAKGENKFVFTNVFFILNKAFFSL
jgi:hypothetical protein